MKLKKILIILLTTGLSATLFSKIFYDYFTSYIKQSYITTYVTQDTKFLPFRETIDYSYISTSEILRRRKLAVKDCHIAPQNYKPSKNIYSNIDETKPWFLTAGAYHRYDINLAQPIENPYILVDIITPFSFLEIPFLDVNDDKYENLAYSLTHRPKVIFNKENNSIDVYYAIREEELSQLNNNLEKFSYFYTLTGINARDLGYKYVQTNNSYNIEMLHDATISRRYKFKDYYGVGQPLPITQNTPYAPEQQISTNQILPRQPELDFRIKALPAKIEMTLYKSQNDIEGQKYNLCFYGFSEFIRKYLKIQDKIKAEEMRSLIFDN